MAIVYNATNEEQSVKVFGQHFTFQPGKLKYMQDSFSRFIATNPNTRAKGLIELDEKFADPEYQNSKAGKEALVKARLAGIDNYLAHHRRVVRNNESLRQDLRMANIDTDPRALMSEGEIKSLEILGEYQSREEDAVQKKIDKVKELEKSLNLGE